MPVAFDFRHEADQTGSVAARSRSIKFGDGYSQRANETLNRSPREIQIECSGMTLAEVQPLDAFLDLHGGATAFFYTPGAEPQGKFIVVQPVQKTKKRAGGVTPYWYTRSFKIMEVFDL